MTSDTLAHRKRLRFWGWGNADEQLAPAEEQRLGEMARMLSREGFTAVPPAARGRAGAAGAAVPIPPGLAPIVSGSRYDRLTRAYGKSWADCARMCLRALPAQPDSSSHSRATSTGRRAARLGRARARIAAIPYGGGTTVVGGVEAAVGDELRGRGLARPRRLDRVLEVDRASAGRAHPGRHPRPRARGAAAAARPHAAPLPAVLRVLDARRLDRDARGRPLRDAPHAHRRLRRVDADGHAARRARDAAPAGLGRRAEPGPPRARLGGHARRDHRGVDAVQARPRCRASASVRFPTLAAGAAAARALAQSGLCTRQLPPARPPRGASTGAGDGAHAAAARLRVRRPPARRLDGARRSSLAATTAAGRRRDAARDGASDARRASGAAGAWRDAFLRALLRDLRRASACRRDVRDRVHLGPLRGVPRGVIERRRPTRSARTCGPAPVMSCRFTHVYPDGPAPYFTFMRRHRGGAAPSSRSGARSRRPPARRWSAAAARSPTTTRSAAITAAVRAGADRRCSATRSPPSSTPRPGRDPQPRRADRPRGTAARHPRRDGALRARGARDATIGARAQSVLASPPVHSRESHDAHPLPRLQPLRGDLRPRDQVEDGRVTAIRGDEADPLSRGHLCPKAAALADLQDDPDRLRRPLLRDGGAWREIGWEEAFDDRRRRLHAVQRTSRRATRSASIAATPSVHNWGLLTHANHFLKRLGTRNLFSATSVDQLPHHLVCLLDVRAPVPAARARYRPHAVPADDRLQPRGSNGSMMTAPDVRARLQGAARARRGAGGDRPAPHRDGGARGPSPLHPPGKRRGAAARAAARAVRRGPGARGRAAVARKDLAELPRAAGALHAGIRGGRHRHRGRRDPRAGARIRRRAVGRLPWPHGRLDAALRHAVPVGDPAAERRSRAISTAPAARCSAHPAVMGAGPDDNPREPSRAARAASAAIPSSAASSRSRRSPRRC